MIFKFRKFHIISNISNIIIYCYIDDNTQKIGTRRRENLFKDIRNITEKVDVYICQNVTVLVRLPNTRKKSYLETLQTLIDISAEVLKRSKHCSILCLARKEKQLLSKLTNLCRKRVWYRKYFCNRCNYSVSKMSTCYAFTSFFFFTFHI